MLLKGVALFVLLNQVLAEFSPELEEAIEFCGGLSALTDGLCPPQDPVEDANVVRKFLPGRNMKPPPGRRAPMAKSAVPGAP